MRYKNMTSYMLVNGRCERDAYNFVLIGLQFQVFDSLDGCLRENFATRSHDAEGHYGTNSMRHSEPSSEFCDTQACFVAIPYPVGKPEI
jgi:hypothetical protein